MKHKPTLIAVAIMLIPVLTLMSGCQAQGGKQNSITRPATGKSLWSDVAVVTDGSDLILGQEGGDIVLEGFGDVLGFRPIPSENRMILALDWHQDTVGFYTLDLHSRTVIPMGGINIQGTRPEIEAYAWPWVLLQAKDEGGNYNWALVDISGDQVELVWNQHRQVPQGLTRRPVWFNGEGWFLGPVSGPVITDILGGNTVSALAGNFINPVLSAWPRWGGPVVGSDWFMIPSADGGGVLLNISTETKVPFSQDQEIVWNNDRSLMAWRQQDQLGLLEPQGTSTVLDFDFLPGSPLWSSDGESLYFFGGDTDYFGTTWHSLWVWDEDEGAIRLFELPGSWRRWRILAATEDAVLASAGENGESLVYFDRHEERYFDLKGVYNGDWNWQGGTLIAISEGDMVRLTPGFNIRALARNVQGVNLLGFVNQFLIFMEEDKVYIRQLAN